NRLSCSIVLLRYLTHRFIKKLTRPMKGFKSFQSASATLDGIEVAHMIGKRQFSTSGQSAFQQFAALAA
ncbi:IS6 family transposase, partial [Rhizobium ruizarguesonis]